MTAAIARMMAALTHPRAGVPMAQLPAFIGRICGITLFCIIAISIFFVLEPKG